ncbi:acyloxyacyl hydrolase [Endozoicomonas ascidiicola]|uniref:acyloxyacyl hydrolase n=1 Tax=Endozoicomonas ascidiicola TaxID=1698521 RepID=UPI00082D3303|nr:acyloxyacyl hydrolase [Endozoicomonas ascidiicola]
MNRGYLLVALILISNISQADWQPDRVSVGHGNFFSPFANRTADIQQYRLGLIWEVSNELWSSENTQLQSYVELALGKWNSSLNPAFNNQRIGADSVNQISVSPVFRLTSQQPAWGNSYPFLDMGVGLSYQSEEDIEQKHLTGINMGGNWQFEIRAMIGMALGENRDFEISYGWMHYSNAYIHDANEGIDFQTLQLTYRFR